MRILIDVGHPADLLLYKEFTLEMEKRQHIVHFTTRRKDVLLDLISSYNFKYNCLGRNYHNLLGKLFGIFKFDIQLLWISIKFRPDIYLSAGSIYASHMAFIFRKPHIVCEDTGNMEQIRLYSPFASAILTSSSFNKKLGNKQIYYNSYHELAYLHPKYFIPLRSKTSNLTQNESHEYIIIRFVSWSASHDIGLKGFTYEEKLNLVKELSKDIKVYINSEQKLPKVLEEYLLPLDPSELHHALAYASLLIGEGATVAAEAAVLGTPAIYINPQSLGYLEEMEQYGLVRNYQKFSKEVLEEAKSIIKDKSSKIVAAENQKRLLSEKIDLTALLVWLVENYPHSVITLRENPDYQYRFLLKLKLNSIN